MYQPHAVRLGYTTEELGESCSAGAHNEGAAKQSHVSRSDTLVQLLHTANESKVGHVQFPDGQLTGMVPLKPVPKRNGCIATCMFSSGTWSMAVEFIMVSTSVTSFAT